MSFIKELTISIIVVTVVAILSSQFMVVPTESMSPAINPGDLVLVERTNVLDVFKELDPNEVHEGDIVVYEKSQEAHAETDHTESGESIIHRVKSVKTSYGNKYLILKGDNNLYADKERVNLSQVRGRAIMWNGNPIIIPKLGFFIFYIKDLLHME